MDSRDLYYKKRGKEVDKRIALLESQTSLMDELTSLASLVKEIIRTELKKKDNSKINLSKGY